MSNMIYNIESKPIDINKVAMSIICNVEQAPRCEIALRRILIDLGLIKQAVRSRAEGIVIYALEVTVEQDETITNKLANA